MTEGVLKAIYVRRAAGSQTRGWMMAGPLAWPVALGRGGILANKREGDGGTPRGIFHPVRLWLRSDRHPRPATSLPIRRITALDGWCEDPSDRRYNRPVRLVAGSPGDRLQRADHLYDFIVEIDHNTRPRVAGRGSAVFLHLARPGLAPTAGCIAMPAERLRQLLKKISCGTRIVVA